MHLNRFLLNFLFIFAISFPAFATILSEPPIADSVFKDQNGNEVHISNFKDIWIADFIFTRCQGMCPLMSGRMAILQEKLSGSGVKFVSFSVDPEHDTPEVLNEYAKRFKAGENWLFLTGTTKSEVWDYIMKNFKLGVAVPSEEELKSGAEPVFHSNRFVLMSGTRIVGYYDTSEEKQLQKIESDAREVLKGMD